MNWILDVGTWYFVDLWGNLYLCMNFFNTLMRCSYFLLIRGKRRHSMCSASCLNIFFTIINYTHVLYFNIGFLHLQPIKSNEKLFPLGWLHNWPCNKKRTWRSVFQVSIQNSTLTRKFCHLHKIIVLCQHTMYLPRQSFFLCASDRWRVFVCVSTLVSCDHTKHACWYMTVQLVVFTHLFLWSRCLTFLFPGMERLWVCIFTWRLTVLLLTTLIMLHRVRQWKHCKENLLEEKIFL